MDWCGLRLHLYMNPLQLSSGVSQLQISPLMTHFDSGFWAHHFRRVFIRELRAFERAVVERVLPAFANLEFEAESIANDEFERLGRMPGDDSIDMSDLAEEAQEEGLAHYATLTGVRQAMLNLFTAALFHMVEQQLLLFHRRQVLNPSEEYNSELFSWKVIHARFENGGVRLRDLNCWPAFHELEVVANTVKHGDGHSADELRGLRPEVLVPVILRNEKGMMGRPTPYVRTPLTGESVHVTLPEFRRYADVAVSFWEEVAEATLCQDSCRTAGVNRWCV